MSGNVAILGSGFTNDGKCAQNAMNVETQEAGSEPNLDAQSPRRATFSSAIAGTQLASNVQLVSPNDTDRVVIDQSPIAYLGLKRDYDLLPQFACALRSSPNHLVGTQQKRFRNFDAEGLGGFEIYDQLELGGLRDRQVAGFGPS